MENNENLNKQATSKSDLVIYLKNILIGIAEYSDSIIGASEMRKHAEMGLIAINENQPHPQDSSSGEVEGGSLPCDICGDAVCQCNNTPPASESLENMIIDFLKEKRCWPKNQHDYEYHSRLAPTEFLNLLKQFIIKWQSTKQQKPLVVLLEEKVIEQAFTVFASHETGRYITSHAMVKEDFVKAVNHLFSMLSSANGVVDLKDFIEWFNYEIFSGEFTWSSKELISKYEEYLTEQSQQK